MLISKYISANFRRSSAYTYIKTYQCCKGNTNGGENESNSINKTNFFGNCDESSLVSSITNFIFVGCKAHDCFENRNWYDTRLILSKLILICFILQPITVMILTHSNITALLLPVLCNTIFTISLGGGFQKEIEAVVEEWGIGGRGCN